MNFLLSPIGGISFGTCLHIEGAIGATNHVFVLTSNDSLMSLVIIVIVFEGAHDSSVVLVVRELDVFEQKASHGEFKSVSFLHLLLDLLAEFGQVWLLMCRRVLITVGTLVIVIGPAASILVVGGVWGHGAKRWILFVETPVALNPSNVFFRKLCR